MWTFIILFSIEKIRKTIPIYFIAKGPVHTFNGHKADFYISTGTGWCSVENRHIAKLDADYFCSSFYGKDYTSTSYVVGTYEESGKLGYLMHNGPRCSSGENITGTDCTGVPCKIVSRSYGPGGLYDIVCSKKSGKIIHVGFFIENSIIFI